jgi:antitoxin (DNA-binding transcriptional repressor) of toxin-antitoxin stability system
LVEAAIRGEAVFITKNGQETVQLVPVTSVQPRPQFGSAKGLIVMSDDFDAPLEDLS